MGKKEVQTKKQASRTLQPRQSCQVHTKTSSFSISDKTYVQFFQFLKELHLSSGQVRGGQIESSYSLNDITTSIMNFFNYERAYSTKQLECSIICLANLFNVIGNNITKLRFENEFVCKLRKFLSDLNQGNQQLGYQQKIQAIFYILTILIYKQRIGEEKSVRDVNRMIFGDRATVNFLLELVLPVQKKIAKFYGIVIIYLTGKKLNNGLKKKVIKSILLNFCKIDHQPTLLNLLVHLRSVKNKIPINLKDIQEGKIFQLLLQLYPKHVHQYQSFYILDYSHHLLLLFPSLAKEAASSRFLPYLLQNAGPANLHHPLHASLIIQFVQRTLKYLQPNLQQKLLEEIVTIEHNQPSITIQLTKMLVNIQENPSNILIFALNGYFNKLLSIIRQDPEESIKTRGIQLFLVIIQKAKIYNQALGEFLTFKIRQSLQDIRDDNKRKMTEFFNSRINQTSQWAI